MTRTTTAAANRVTFRFLAGASVYLVACGTDGLRNHGPDAASGSGGSAIGSGGILGYGGSVISGGGGSYGGSGGSSAGTGGKAGSTTVPSTGGAVTTGGTVATGGRTGYGGSDGAVGGTGGGKADAGAEVSSQPDAAMVADAPAPGADGGWGDVGAALADFCVGSQSKVFYSGQTYEAPVTSKWTDPFLSCCILYAARLHTTPALGKDFELVLWSQGGSETTGVLHVGPSGGNVRVTLRTKPESNDAGLAGDPMMTGSVNIAGKPFGSDAWTLGACVSVDDPASPFVGTRVYVPAVPVAPSNWASRLRFLPLKDTKIQVSSVEYKDIQTLDLATDPMIDLMDIDFVDLETTTCGAHGASTCNWVGLNSPFLSGTTLVSEIPGTAPSMPFVVEADGERIYLGVFQSINSAYAPRVSRVGFEDIRDDGFPIYPPPSTSTFADLRNDPRIVKVLTEAGKYVP
jgi:hypothetical protein